MMQFHSTPKDRENEAAAEDLVRLALKRVRDRADRKKDEPEDMEEEDDDRD